ncbi:POTRA domain-containing protein [Bosea sp. (in: a-proteobacteria)]|uniref:ShlB/FhaC/HecB family hemolysin secretion/activation protein n=1 Tax=Bosea sp. (in: a-proteobacteria) TaxID=1871050 RepID=UPI0012158BCA|nr:POTRA domain-containing protein [Bosea sp. (in: a-proteobacteria)]TAJ33863.1 MAG: ShlB/FhaC/HecB family hemolysin secretion/activation protein [Bosea sp. (in: a-proteobacteria)]
MMRKDVQRCLAAAALGAAMLPWLPIGASAQPFLPSARPPQPGVESQSERRESEERRAPVALPAIAPSAAAGEQKPVFRLKEVALEGASALPALALADIYAPHLGRDITTADLSAIAAGITDLYRRAGYHLSRALIPPQDMRGGVLRVTVVEGVIADARISGGSAVFGLDNLLEPIRQERPARLATMERQLLLINERPGVKVVDTTLDEIVPGSGRFRLTIKAETWRLYGAAGLDNMGSVSSGPWQGSANLALNSLVVPGDSLSVSGSFVPGHPRELRYGRLAYELPLGSESWKVGIAASHSDIWPGDLRRYIRDRSKSDTVEARLSFAPILSQMQSLWLTGAIGVTRASEQAFIGPLSADRIGIASLTADYKLHLRDSSWTYASVTVRKGLGLIDDQPDSADWLSRIGASPHFTLINGALTHYENLTDRWSVRLAAGGQLASGPLLTSQQYALGGLSFGRGFDAGWISGDDAIAGSAELRFDQSLTGLFAKGYQLFSFVEGGAARYRLSGGGLDQSFMSVGAGARVFLTDDLNLTVGVAKPVVVNSPFEPRRGARLLFSLSNAFRL